MQPWTSVKCIKKGKYEGVAGVVQSSDPDARTAAVKMDSDGETVSFKWSELVALA